MNIAARYGAPSPARAAGDASASILRKAIDTAAQSERQLIEALPASEDLSGPAPGSAAEAEARPPIGNVGHRLDIRM